MTNKRKTLLQKKADKITKLAVRNLNQNVIREDKMTLEEHRKEQSKKDAQIDKARRESKFLAK